MIGGRNLGDAYFDAHPDSDFADLDVLAAGPVVTQFSDSFDEYWNSEAAVPIAAFAGEPPSAVEVNSHLSQIATRAERFHETDYARTLRTTDLARLLRTGRLALVAARRRSFSTTRWRRPGKGLSRSRDALLRQCVRSSKGRAGR